MASLNFDDVSRGTDNKKTKRTPHGATSGFRTPGVSMLTPHVATPVLFHSHGNHDAITIFIFRGGGSILFSQKPQKFDVKCILLLE